MDGEYSRTSQQKTTAAMSQLGLACSGIDLLSSSAVNGVYMYQMFGMPDRPIF